MHKCLPLRRCPSGSSAHQQAGLAAIEFALIATVLALMLLGLTVYWRALQAQQSVTRATGDGARLVQSLIYGTQPGYDIRVAVGVEKLRATVADAVKQSLQDSGVPGDVMQNTIVSLTASNLETRLNVAYQLPPLFGAGSSVSEPTTLHSSAVVSYQLAPGSKP